MPAHELTFYLGYISIALLAAGLTFVVLKWPHGVQYTFSQHVAPRNSSSIFYSFLFIVTLTLLQIFFASYFIPVFELPILFTQLLVISWVAQILCTFFPERGKEKTKIHRVFAGISAACLPLLLALLAVWPTIDGFDKILTGACLVIMLDILCLALFTQFRKTHALVLQIAYNVAFFIPIFFIAYL